MATKNVDDTPVKSDVASDVQPNVVENRELHRSNHAMPVENTYMSGKNCMIFAIIACVALTFVGFSIGFLLGHNTAYTRDSRMMNSGREYRYGNDLRRGMMRQNFPDETTN